MKTATLVFESVGRDKLSWSVPLQFPARNLHAAADQAVREIRRKRALMSSRIEVAFVDTSPTAIIYARGFRAVGSVTIVEDNAK